MVHCFIHTFEECNTSTIRYYDGNEGTLLYSLIHDYAVKLPVLFAMV